MADMRVDRLPRVFGRSAPMDTRPRGIAVKAWVLALLPVLGFCFLTDIPDRIADGWPGIEDVAAGISVAVHVAAFLALTLAMLSARWPFRPATAVLAVLALAGGTELGQMFIPRRTSRLDDFLLNVAGVALATAIWWGFSSIRRPQPAATGPDTIPLPHPPTSRRKAA